MQSRRASVVGQPRRGSVSGRRSSTPGGVRRASLSPPGARSGRRRSSSVSPGRRSARRRSRSSSAAPDTPQPEPADAVRILGAAAVAALPADVAVDVAVAIPAGVLLKYGTIAFCRREGNDSFVCRRCSHLRYRGRWEQADPDGWTLCPRCWDEESSEQSRCAETAAKKAAEDRRAAMTETSAAVGAPAARNAPDGDGVTPLLLACVAGRFRAAKDLIDRADITKDVDMESAPHSGPHAGRTALLLAAQHGHRDIVTLLLERQAHREAVDGAGWTALMHAAYCGHVPVVDELLFAGVRVDRVAFCGYTALLLAANRGHTIAAMRLLSAGATPAARTPRGRTALIVAALNGHLEAVRALLRVPAVEREATDDEGYDALLAAKSAGHHKVVELLATPVVVGTDK